MELLIPVRVAAAGYAAVRRTAAQMKEIRYWHRSLDEAIRDGAPGIEQDIGFHRAIVDAAGNPLFRDMLDFLDARARPFVETSRANSRAHGLTMQVQAEHKHIMEAIRARDAAGARSTSEIHLVNALKRLGVHVAVDGS